jgi:hypothetical protein
MNMIYTLKLKLWMDHHIQIRDIKESTLVLKPYYENVKETFIEHHSCMGLDTEEAEDLFQESPFPKVEKWLKKKGYEL